MGKNKAGSTAKTTKPSKKPAKKQATKVVGMRRNKPGIDYLESTELDGLSDSEWFEATR